MSSTDTWQAQTSELAARVPLDVRSTVARPSYIGSETELLSAWQTSSLRRDAQYSSQMLRTSIPLWIADQLTLLIALVMTYYAGIVVSHTVEPIPPGLAISLVLALTLVNYVVGLYPGIGLSAENELRLTTRSVSMIACIVLVARGATQSMPFEIRLAHLLVFAACLILMPLARRAMRTIVCRYQWWGQPTLIFGGGDDGAAAFHSLLKHPELGLRPVGLIDDLNNHWNDSVADPAWNLGSINHLPQIAESTRAFWGVVAMPHRTSEDVAAVIDNISITLPNLLILPDFAKAGRGWDGAHDCGGRFGARCTEMLLLPVPRLIKRTMDLILGIIIIVLLLPVMLLIAIAIKLTSPGRIFYQQIVPGLAGRRFCMWKFRTMYVNSNQIFAKWLAQCPELQSEWDRYHKLQNDPRVTPIGRILRRASLDELPQLFNVLRGEMSLVGPRAYPLYECDEMQTKAPLVLRIRPGITGLWQVSGRSNMTFEQRLQIDTRYVRNWSLWIDLAILAKTLVVVARKKGAY